MTPVMPVNEIAGTYGYANATGRTRVETDLCCSWERRADDYRHKCNGQLTHDCLVCWSQSAAAMFRLFRLENFRLFALRTQVNASDNVGRANVSYAGGLVFV
jgi:hypothetical protein